MKKYTVRLLLAKHAKNKDGHYPIYIRITVDRKTSYLATGHHITEKFWDAKNQVVKDGHPLASIINPDITHRKSELLRSLVDAQIKGVTLTAASLKTTSTSKANFHNIFEFRDQFIKDVKHKREGSTLENYRKHLARLQLFHGSKDLNFEDITPAFLQRYEDHLREGDLAKKNKKVGGNYTHALFKTLKTLFNSAKRKGLITVYPFAKYENPIYVAPVKDYLSLAELQKWEEYADGVTDPVLKQTAVYFLLGCYSGLRISDWRKFNIETHIIGDKLKLRAKKNGELIVMPISKPLARNLKRIETTVLTIEEPTINEKLKVIARALKINKKITSHTGRHTFAVTMCAEQGVSSETCAELMAITISTCVENYYRVSGKKIEKETLAAWKDLA